MIARPYLLVLLAEGPSHGYQLVERLADFGVDVGTPAGVYRLLREMERAGLVHSVWELSQSRGPARRVYSIAAAGRRALDADMVDLAATERSLATLRTRYVALNKRSTRRQPSAAAKR
ncbi:MAG: PadR family transcriptional regulator [Acidimicrobiales bacterium]